ncbi:MAG TPA: response regulator [Candidatus Sulfotelmatobacter sp.]|nr:response regulator [Candidatus Sulfotelmatobacter sp.]
MNTPARPLVLNVEDRDAPRYVKTHDLHQAGFDVIEAVNGVEALRLVEAHMPSIVLLDVQLPDLSGFEVCRTIKQKWPGVMVLLTSATFVSSSDRTLGLDSGADSYLVQPSEPLELGAAVNALLRIRRSESELRRLNESLEQRVQDRVADLAEANAKLRDEIAQREKAEAALVQAEKMQAVGQLTGGLAHDFNNLLTAVVGNLDLIRNRTTETRIRRLADNAFKAAQRGARLTAQLLAFSRTQKLVLAPVDVNTVIVGMRELLNQSLGPNVAIELRLDAGMPTVMADANQLELAILNLSINARDAMPEGGTLTIATTAAGKDGLASILVSDTGHGMSREVVSRAFDPFFTTKPAGKGTGLGLSQVYGIARQCGGDVTLKSEVGKGTTVTLLLPPAGIAAVPATANEAEVVRSRNAEKLLIIDDDLDVQELVSEFLTDLGYEVRLALDGEEALAIVPSFKPDLLILDFAMPGVNGADVAIAMRAHYPGIPILFASGFADSDALNAAVGSAPLLRKPFRPGDLATAVRSLLDGGRG